MKQRVNIQYSVDMDELPEEVHRLLKKGETTLKNICEEEMHELVSIKENEILSVQVLDAVDEMRKKLAATDYVLNDVANIINGFINYKVAPPKKDSQTVETSELPPEFKDPENIANEAVMTDLKYRIDEFKKDVIAKKASISS